jgi:hypothetical protein
MRGMGYNAPGARQGRAVARDARGRGAEAADAGGRGGRGGRVRGEGGHWARSHCLFVLPNHPRYTRLANIFGTSFSEPTMRPNPRWTSAGWSPRSASSWSPRSPSSAAAWRRSGTRCLSLVARTNTSRCIERVLTPCTRAGSVRGGRGRARVSEESGLQAHGLRGGGEL